MTEKSTTDVATVLLVEDDDLTLKLLSSILSKFSYHLLMATDSAEAIQLINDHHPDVIVCDLHLPNGNGLVVLRHAMNQPQAARVIVLTGDTATEPVVDALRAGAHDYLLKPCSAKALRESVANALVRRQLDLEKLDQTQQLLKLTTALQHSFNITTEPAPVSTSVLSIGPLRINQEQLSLAYHNQTIHLTPVEHKIVYKLIEAAGEVVPFSAMAEYTYQRQMSSAEAQSLLKPHIWKIRQKTSKQLILTTWGVGYRLNTATDQEE